MLDVTIRNAKRLQHLTEDILDVTKIESHSLNLKKEQFNLNVATRLQELERKQQPYQYYVLYYVNYKIPKVIMLLIRCTSFTCNKLFNAVR